MIRSDFPDIVLLITSDISIANLGPWLFIVMINDLEVTSSDRVFNEM